MDPAQNVLERFSEMEPHQFENEIDKLWSAGRAVVDTVAELVQNEQISPLQGLGIIGCTTSQLYGYNAFHGEASGSDLVSALASSRIRA